MREILEDHVKLPIAQAAKRMQISRPSLYAVLNGKSAVTPDMALRFGKLVGGDAELYVRMQVGYSMWHARKANEQVLKKIKPVPTLA
jgi:addiction module HigA family antidote